MHLGLIDGPFVPHNLISTQESPAPLRKWQDRSKRGSEYATFGCLSHLFCKPAWLMTWLTRASDNGWLLCGICDVAVSAALLNWCTVPISHATYTKITCDGRQHCSWHSENEVPSTVIFHFVHCQSIGLIYFTSEKHLPISLDITATVETAPFNTW